MAFLARATVSSWEADGLAASKILRRAATAAGVTAFAVNVWRFFHGFALWAAILLSITCAAAAVWMRAFLAVCHL